jgi:hypothetical protein
MEGVTVGGGTRQKSSVGDVRVSSEHTVAQVTLHCGRDGGRDPVCLVLGRARGGCWWSLRFL